MTRLLVDAFNVIGSRPTGWWRDRPGAVRDLVSRLRHLSAVDGAQITAVVDGSPIEGLPEGEHGGVHVLYAPGGAGAADDRIAELVEADEDPGSLRVVTSDRRLRRRVRDRGADVMGASELLGRLESTEGRA